MEDLSFEDMRSIEGGSLTAAGVAAGLLGFGAGAVIGFVVIAGIMYVASR